MSKIKIDTIRKTFTDYQRTGEHGYRHFAVIIPVVELEGRICLAYEVRSAGLDRQPGEVCFPGGLIEEGETPCACALRETEEELGISRDDIEIITELDSICTTSGSQIFCFVGIVSGKAFAEIKPSAAEVAEVFTVDIDVLLKARPEMYYGALQQKPDPDFPYDRVTNGRIYPWASGNVPVPVYDIMANDGKRIIWGLTGRMTKQFLEVLKCSN